MANIQRFGQCSCTFPQQIPTENGTGIISKVFKTEFLRIGDGPSYSRQHVCGPNPNQWKELDEIVRPKTPPKNKSLWVVRQRQEGKNPHWCIFAAVDDDSDSPKGRVWQVNGDPDTGMHYAHSSPEQGIAIFLSISFADSLLVCDKLTPEREAKLDQIANTIPPPGPPQTLHDYRPRSLTTGRGTCRTWAWAVIDELATHGIVSSAAAADARKLYTVKPPS